MDFGIWWKLEADFVEPWHLVIKVNEWRKPQRRWWRLLLIYPPFPCAAPLPPLHLPYPIVSSPSLSLSVQVPYAQLSTILYLCIVAYFYPPSPLFNELFSVLPIQLFLTYQWKNVISLFGWKADFSSVVSLLWTVFVILSLSSRVSLWCLSSSSPIVISDYLNLALSNVLCCLICLYSSSLYALW